MRSRFFHMIFGRLRDERAARFTLETHTWAGASGSSSSLSLSLSFSLTHTCVVGRAVFLRRLCACFRGRGEAFFAEGQYFRAALWFRKALAYYEYTFPDDAGQRGATCRNTHKYGPIFRERESARARRLEISLSLSLSDDPFPFEKN